MNLPSFFYDNSESDKFEEIIDFFLSWTIRCAESKFSKDYPLIQTQASKILSNLIFSNSNGLDNRVVTEVKIWKQSNNVDLWVELKIDDVNHAIIIENKMYSGIRQNQLEKYKIIANDHYNRRKKNFQLHFVFIRPDYGTDNFESRKIEIDFVNKNEYKHLKLEGLAEIIMEERPTGNYMFDSFWHTNWK